MEQPSIVYSRVLYSKVYTGLLSTIIQDIIILYGDLVVDTRTLRDANYLYPDVKYWFLPQVQFSRHQAQYKCYTGAVTR